VVWGARNTRLPREVALKALPADKARDTAHSPRVPREAQGCLSMLNGVRSRGLRNARQRLCQSRTLAANQLAVGAVSRQTGSSQQRAESTQQQRPRPWLG